MVYEKRNYQHVASMGQSKNLSPKQELNPRPPENLSYEYSWRKLLFIYDTHQASTASNRNIEVHCMMRKQDFNSRVSFGLKAMAYELIYQGSQKLGMCTRLFRRLWARLFFECFQ